MGKKKKKCNSQRKMLSRPSSSRSWGTVGWGWGWWWRSSCWGGVRVYNRAWAWHRPVVTAEQFLYFLCPTGSLLFLGLSACLPWGCPFRPRALPPHSPPPPQIEDANWERDGFWGVQVLAEGALRLLQTYERQQNHAVERLGCRVQLLTRCMTLSNVLNLVLQFLGNPYDHNASQRFVGRFKWVGADGETEAWGSDAAFP